MISYKQLESLLKLDEEALIADQKAQKIRAYSLVISHRQLRKIPMHIPSKQYAITRLDLSYNYFKDLKQLRQQPNSYLQYLNVSFNFVQSIDGFGSSFRSLKILDANANRIQSIELNDQDFPALEALIKFFVFCPKTIEILCLDHNLLDKLAFEGGQKLQILSASANKIGHLEIKNSSRITYLDLEENQISDLSQMQRFLKACPNLLSVNLIGNYVSKIAHKRYLVTVLTACNKVVKVDEVIINPHVREAFKIMEQEQQMESVMQDTADLYRRRMEEQLQLKEQILDKLKSEQRQVEDKFQQYLRQEKAQLDSLEGYARENLGKKKFAIATENPAFQEKADLYKGADLQQDPTEEIDIDTMKKGAIQQHKEDYLAFRRLQNQSQTKNSSRKSQYKKYLGTDNNMPNGDKFEFQSQLSNEELDDKQIERRKRNMRNPSLVYRNSNELLGLSALIQQDSSIDKEDEILDKKCLPYLVKNYGFHTIV